MKAIKKVAELIAKDGLSKTEDKLKIALKEYYGIPDVYFWKEKNNEHWKHCSDVDPKKSHKHNYHECVSELTLHDMSWFLSGLSKGRYEILFNYKRHTLGEIKKFMLVKKLAGL